MCVDVYISAASDISGLSFPPLQVDSGDLIHCKETVDQYLHSLELPLPANAIYIFNSIRIHDSNQDHCGGRNLAEQEQQQYLQQARGGQLSGMKEEDDDNFDGLGPLYDLEGDRLKATEKDGLKEGHDDQATALQTNVSHVLRCNLLASRKTCWFPTSEIL